MKCNSWTENDLKKLRACAEEGYSVYRIAVILKRTVDGVKTMAHRQGIVIRTSKEIANSLRGTANG